MKRLRNVCTMLVQRLWNVLQCLYSECLYSVCAILHNVCTVTVQCVCNVPWLYNVCAVSVQFCTVSVQHLFNDCAMSVQWLYKVCALSVHFLQDAETSQRILKNNRWSRQTTTRKQNRIVQEANDKAKMKFKGQLHFVDFLIWLSTFSSEPQRDAL